MAQTDKAGNPSPSSSGVALVGTAGKDTLTGTSGNDLLIGGAARGHLLFNGSFGNDIIAGFAAGNGAAHDIVRLVGTGLNTFGDILSHATQGTRAS